MSDPLDFAIDLDDVRKRLIALNYFVAVEDLQTATEILSADDAYAFNPPAAFVSVASETAEKNRTIGGHRQRVSVTLSILFAESAARADRGADDQVERTRRAIIRQLVAWTPRGAESALEYQRYLIRATGGGLIWSEVLFTTTYFLAI